MDDGLLVGRAVDGDLDAFGQLYDRYFNRIYDFCWRITRDAEEAADATQDVFIKAMQGLPGLAKASSFKSWIFTIAHNTAVTRAERAGGTAPLPVPSHDEAFGSFDMPDPSRLDNPEIVAEDHELAGLVWEATSSLNPRDYALLDMHVRQGIESAEIAQALNITKGNASTMVSRMKTAAADVISGYVLARRGSGDCEALRGVVGAFEFLPYTEDVRHAVDTHVKACEVCQRSRKAFVPLQIFGSFTPVAAPFALKGDVWRDVSTAWPYGEGAAFAAAGAGEGQYDFADTDDAALSAAGSGDGGGGAFALPMMGGGEGGNRIVLFAVAVLGMLVFAFAIAGAVILASGAGGDDDGGGGPSDATETAQAGTPTGTPGVIVESPTPDLTASVTPTPEPDTETPTPAPPTETPLPTETFTPEPPTATATRTPRGFRTPTPTPTQVVATFTPVPATPTPTPP
jgi:RNA polymerase sigma factor (sigma-70 family)